MKLPSLNIESYDGDGAEHTLCLWLEAWAGHDWAAMCDLSQLTWRHKDNWRPPRQEARRRIFDRGKRQPEPVSPERWLEAWFGQKRLTDARILRRGIFHEVMCDVLVEITYEFPDPKRPARLGGQRTATVRARLVREAGLRKPSSTGAWGVNPTSVLREEPPERDEK